MKINKKHSTKDVDLEKFIKASEELEGKKAKFF